MTQFADAEACIRQLHAHYADAVWRKDAVAFAQCFTPDAEWRIGGQVMRGRAEIAREFERSLFSVRRVLIEFRTPQLELTGSDRASGKVYATEHFTWSKGRPTTAIGRYYEYYADAGDRWRISWRLYELLYSGPADLSGEFRENAALLP